MYLSSANLRFKKLGSSFFRCIVILVTCSLSSSSVFATDEPILVTPKESSLFELQTEKIDVDDPVGIVSKSTTAPYFPTNRRWKLLGGVSTIILGATGIGLLAKYLGGGSNSKGFDRGMYVSTWSNLVPGQPDKYKYALTDTNKINDIFNLIANQSMQSLVLYDIGHILDIGNMSQNLIDFLSETRKLGVKEIYVAGSKESDFQAAAHFQNSYPNQFDGLITEYEFWNAVTDQRTDAYNTFLELLRSMRSLKLTSNGKPAKIASYISVLDNVPNLSAQKVAEDIASLSDRVIVTCYGQTPHESFQRCKSTISLMMNAGTKTELVPALSAESNALNARGEGFLGDYIASHPALEEIENYLRSRFSSELDLSDISGFYYFKYALLDFVLEPA